MAEVAIQKAIIFKEEGNQYFREGEFHKAKSTYGKALAYGR